MKRTSVIAAVLSFLAAACGANEGVLRSGRETPGQQNSASQPTKSSIERDLDEMRTAGFAFIYVLRRKDGQKLDAEDRGVIRLQTTDTNRRVMSDDDRAVVIGTNYAIPPENIMVLYSRFAVENYSPAPSPENVNSPANAAK
jgi:hypothetical protein